MPCSRETAAAARWWLELCKARRLQLAETETDCTVTSTGGGDEDFEFSADTY